MEWEGRRAVGYGLHVLPFEKIRSSTPSAHAATLLILQPMPSPGYAVKPRLAVDYTLLSADLLPWLEISKHDIGCEDQG